MVECHVTVQHRCRTKLRLAEKSAHFCSRGLEVDLLYIYFSLSRISNHQGSSKMGYAGVIFHYYYNVIMKDHTPFYSLLDPPMGKNIFIMHYFFYWPATLSVSRYLQLTVYMYLSYWTLFWDKYYLTNINLNMRMSGGTYFVIFCYPINIIIKSCYSVNFFTGKSYRQSLNLVWFGLISPQFHEDNLQTTFLSWG